MSANVGGSASENTAVNLTPLLDVVLQLIMFFMMCVNFVSEQFNMNVVLAPSMSAVETTKKDEADMLVINIEVLREDRLDPATGKALMEKDESGAYRTVRRVVTTSNGQIVKRISIRPYGRLGTRFTQKDGTKGPFLNIEFPIREKLPDNPNMKVWYYEKDEDAAAKRAEDAIAEVARDIKEKERSKVGTATEEGETKTILQVPVILRSDAKSPGGLVVRFISTCHVAGFKKIEIGALITK